jgi:hypothetical protein
LRTAGRYEGAQAKGETDRAVSDHGGLSTRQLGKRFSPPTSSEAGGEETRNVIGERA